MEAQLVYLLQGSIWMQSFLLPAGPWQKAHPRTTRLLHKKESPVRQVWSRSLQLALGPVVWRALSTADLPAMPVQELRVLAAILSHICPLYILLVTSATVQCCCRSLDTLFSDETGNCSSHEATVLALQTPTGYVLHLPLPSVKVISRVYFSPHCRNYTVVFLQNQ